MSKKIIWSIIIIMSSALIGVGAIQFFWIQRAVDLDEKNFNDKVTIALENVKKKLQTDAIAKFDEKNRTEVSTEISELVSPDIPPSEVNIRMKDMEYKAAFLDPYEQLIEIDVQKLDKYVEREISSKNIELDYEYGVYSNRDKNYIIINGNYSATIGDTSKSSNVADMNPLYKAEYKMPLFDEALAPSPGHLNLYFPGKKRFLWSNVRGILISSILFTALILFCFSYTIYIIFHQKKVSEMKTDFINNMTHEFKTPIATISLASDSVLNPSIIENKDKVTRFIQIIKQENGRMLSQVEKVLQMAQIEKQNFELKLRQVDIHDIIEDALVNAELKVQSKGGTIHAELAAQRSIVICDATHISNVINNLLDNAEKYTPEKPEIWVRTKNVKNGIEISVQDNGIGMSKDAQKYIFEKFYRVHTGNIHNVKGFGLGLSYVKAIVDAHKGHVTVKSEPEKGSTFAVFLPES
jgi:two-component system phosphate regulon sensor histidine kinase PhoR